MMKQAMLYENLADKKVHCYLCNHHCRIADTEFGLCGVRENRGGELYTHAYGQAVAAQVDPIEKKPLFHVLPGSKTFSIAAAGCNFKCAFCQNWQISQIFGKQHADSAGTRLLPEEIVRQAKENTCASIAYTYTEPTIFFEYALDTAQLAAQEGLLNIFVTNGYMTKEALVVARPYLNACNVDLKSFREKFYSEICRGHLKPVLESIRLMKELGIWVEITTLIIPGLNDSEDELLDIARFIAGIDPSMPWHISRFHPDYRFAESAPTSRECLEKARDIGICEGLYHVYIGNVAGAEEITHCVHCSKPVIHRQAFLMSKNALKGNLCPSCGNAVAGIFRAITPKKTTMEKERRIESHMHGSV